jgi:hypothetical protein
MGSGITIKTCTLRLIETSQVVSALSHADGMKTNPINNIKIIFGNKQKYSFYPSIYFCDVKWVIMKPLDD